jgi:hypothetical protein
MTQKIDRPSRSKSTLIDYRRKKREEDEEFAPTVEEGIDDWRSEEDFYDIIYSKEEDARAEAEAQASYWEESRDEEE